MANDRIPAVHVKARNLLIGIFAAVTILLIIIAMASRDNSLLRLQRAGVIRIGYAIEAPYAILEPGGRVTGESAEIARLVVARLEINQIEWRLVEFDELIPELMAGRIDVIAAGMFITPQRAQQVNFSIPTFHVRQALLVAKGNQRQLHSYQDAVGQNDIKIAVLAGAVEEGMLREMGLLDHQLIVVPDALTGRVAVESGLADGLALSAPTIQWMAINNQLGLTEMAQPFEQPRMDRYSRLGYGAYAFRKTDRQLLAGWDRELTALIGSPEHLRLISPFGFTEADLPGNVTVRDIIKP